MKCQAKGSHATSIMLYLRRQGKDLLSYSILGLECSSNIDYFVNLLFKQKTHFSTSHGNSLLSDVYMFDSWIENETVKC